MYAPLKRLYDFGSLSKDGLKNAVKEPKKWVTPDEYHQITGEAYA